MVSLRPTAMAVIGNVTLWSLQEGQRHRPRSRKPQIVSEALQQPPAVWEGARACGTGGVGWRPVRQRNEIIFLAEFRCNDIGQHRPDIVQPGDLPAR
jgi:hypothetical protein